MITNFRAILWIVAVYGLALALALAQALDGHEARQYVYDEIEERDPTDDLAWLTDDEDVGPHGHLTPRQSGPMAPMNMTTVCNWRLGYYADGNLVVVANCPMTGTPPGAPIYQMIWYGLSQCIGVNREGFLEWKLGGNTKLPKSTCTVNLNNTSGVMQYSCPPNITGTLDFSQAHFQIVDNKLQCLGGGDSFQFTPLEWVCKDIRLSKDVPGQLLARCPYDLSKNAGTLTDVSMDLNLCFGRNNEGQLVAMAGGNAFETCRDCKLDVSPKLLSAPGQPEVWGRDSFIQCQCRKGNDSHATDVDYVVNTALWLRNIYLQRGYPSIPECEPGWKGTRMMGHRMHHPRTLDAPKVAERPPVGNWTQGNGTVSNNGTGLNHKRSESHGHLRRRDAPLDVLTSCNWYLGFPNGTLDFDALPYIAAACPMTGSPPKAPVYQFVTLDLDRCLALKADGYLEWKVNDGAVAKPCTIDDLYRDNITTLNYSCPSGKRGTLDARKGQFQIIDNKITCLNGPLDMGQGETPFLWACKDFSMSTAPGVILANCPWDLRENAAYFTEVSMDLNHCLGKNSHGDMIPMPGGNAFESCKNCRLYKTIEDDWLSKGLPGPEVNGTHMLIVCDCPDGKGKLGDDTSYSSTSTPLDGLIRLSRASPSIPECQPVWKGQTYMGHRMHFLGSATNATTVRDITVHNTTSSPVSTPVAKFATETGAGSTFGTLSSLGTSVSPASGPRSTTTVTSPLP